MKKDSDHPHVLAPPPVIYGLFLAAGLGLNYLLPTVVLPAVFCYPVGGVLFVSGLCLVVAAIRRFHQANTPVEPWKESRAIVMDGPYRYSRNPIYAAMSSMYLGVGFAVNSLWILALFVPLIVVMRHGVIAREERYLEKKFGDTYRSYKARVRRWL